MKQKNIPQNKSSDWTTISFPKALAAEIAEIIKYLGYRSIAEYARHAAREKVSLDQHKVREIKEAMKSHTD